MFWRCGVSTDLVAWLRKQIAEDRRRAREAQPGPWHIGNAVDPTKPCNIHTFPGARGVLDDLNWLDAEHIVTWNPARVLAECDAKERLLATGGPFCELCDSDEHPPRDPATNWTVRIPHHYDCPIYVVAQYFALPYADRIGFRDEWRSL